MKKHFYKINVEIYQSLVGIDKINYIEETEILLNPLRYDKYFYWG
jgi:hypothetical protein